MPTYLYETVPQPGGAARRFEVRQKFDDPVLGHDPETGEPVRRVISGGMGFLAKGAEDSAEAPGCGPESCTCGRFS
jgi:predicted nucleic acid-binding Zn ribbon protein